MLAPRIDNDDDDPDQPTYRQDNMAFEMICKLEEEKKKLRKKVDSMHKYKHEAASLRTRVADLERDVEKAAKDLKGLEGYTKAYTAASQSLTLLQRENRELKAKKAPPVPAPALGPSLPKHVFVCLYRYQSASEHSMDTAEVKGVFLDLDTANRALDQLRKLCFDNWECQRVRKRATSEIKVEDVDPDDNEVFKWANMAGELRLVVNEADTGKGFLWVEKREIQGADQVKAWKEERREKEKENARRLRALEVPSTATHARMPVPDDATPAVPGSMSPLKAEPMILEHEPTSPDTHSEQASPLAALSQRYELPGLSDQSAAEAIPSMELDPLHTTVLATADGVPSSTAPRKVRCISLDREPSPDLEEVRKHESSPPKPHHLLTRAVPQPPADEKPALNPDPLRFQRGPVHLYNRDWESYRASEPTVKVEPATPTSSRKRRHT